LHHRLLAQIGLERHIKTDNDLTDIPEVLDWSDAVISKFYCPIKKSLTIRIDADVVAWLRSQGKGYQTRINQLLRAAMQSPARKRRA